MIKNTLSMLLLLTSALFAKELYWETQFRDNAGASAKLAVWQGTTLGFSNWGVYITIDHVRHKISSIHQVQTCESIEGTEHDGFGQVPSHDISCENIPHTFEGRTGEFSVTFFQDEEMVIDRLVLTHHLFHSGATSSYRFENIQLQD